MRGRASTLRRRAAQQSGYSLIEVLIAVMLVGTVIAALAAGMLTMMSATKSTSDQQRLEAGVLTYTEFLRAQDYTDCAGAGTYPGWQDDGGTISGRVDSVQYWQRAAGEAWGDGSYGAGCSADLGRQLVTVAVELPSGPSTTAQVVLREEVEAP